MKKLILILLCVIPMLRSDAQLKISQFPPANTLSGAEMVPVTQGGVTARTTVSAIVNLASSQSYSAGYGIKIQGGLIVVDSNRTRQFVTRYIDSLVTAGGIGGSGSAVDTFGRSMLKDIDTIFQQASRTNNPTRSLNVKIAGGAVLPTNPLHAWNSVAIPLVDSTNRNWYLIPSYDMGSAAVADPFSLALWKSSNGGVRNIWLREDGASFNDITIPAAWKSSLKISGGGGGVSSNIYTANGTLTGNRTVNLSTYNLTMSGSGTTQLSSGTNFFFLQPSSIAMIAGTASLNLFPGTTGLFLAGLGGGSGSVILKTNTVTGSKTFTFPNLSGQLALRDDTNSYAASKSYVQTYVAANGGGGGGGGSSIYTTDGLFTSNRVAYLNGKVVQLLDTTTGFSSAFNIGIGNSDFSLDNDQISMVNGSTNFSISNEKFYLQGAGGYLTQLLNAPSGTVIDTFNRSGKIATLNDIHDSITAITPVSSIYTSNGTLSSARTVTMPAGKGLTLLGSGTAGSQGYFFTNSNSSYLIVGASTSAISFGVGGGLNTMNMSTSGLALGNLGGGNGNTTLKTPALGNTNTLLFPNKSGTYTFATMDDTASYIMTPTATATAISTAISALPVSATKAYADSTSIANADVEINSNGFAPFDKRWGFVSAGNSAMIFSGGLLGSNMSAISGTSSALAIVSYGDLLSSIPCFKGTSTAAANASAGYKTTATNVGVWRSSTTYGGGFKVVEKFGASVFASTSRLFVGLLGTGTNGIIQASEEPSAGAFPADMIGIGKDGADVNLQLMYNDAAGTATKVDLGEALDNTAVYKLTITNAAGTANYKLTLQKTTTTTKSTVYSGTVSTNVPSANALLIPEFFSNTGAGTSAITLHFISVYADTDY